MPYTSNTHKKNIVTAGIGIEEAKKALIMIHGRGGSADNILSLSDHLQVKDFALLAPQATNNTWYPFSFMAPPPQNEPWLSSAISLIKEVVNDVTGQGITAENIYFLGFSQGACLTLEFVTRNAQRYGGVVAFTGGLIGDKIYPGNYSGDFAGTPVFIGSSNPDPHVPVERVYATSNILKTMHAAVTEKIYNNMGHTINQDEIDLANTLVFNAKI
ncbi:dienelactone hydrolase family protein [Agriterribacter sp.]|mgnify:CR=1 FL=1|uniref:alpha/beta hydrolase n=1 Tax=Agriterribacter sp. TaxID=2821509 RepID=UPI002C670310|nr:dienelactone hydrolase family protein [Agriterribacter sp.]HRO47507.1 dienelactone hydrolase family protein [Agriterribacter sp.]HRQ18327.1 dienelactone hydrolase family protein [Agriterribacter sp.]